MMSYLPRYNTDRNSRPVSMYSIDMPESHLGRSPRFSLYSATNPAYQPDDCDDDATYELDHLATYTVSRDRGLVSPRDGLARLRHMAQTTGVWTKRLKLRVGARDLVVIDSTEPIERFPLRLVGDVECAVGRDTPDKAYDNVVVFTVAPDDLVAMRRRPLPAEMHLFHCLGRRGKELVDDIQAAKAGKPLPSLRKVEVSSDRRPQVVQQDIYTRPMKPTRDAVVDIQPDTPPQLSAAYAPRSHQGAPAGAVVVPVSNVPPPVPAPAAAPAVQPPPPEMSPAEKKAVDARVLDKCFSDIERFVTRLQKAASAVSSTDTADSSTKRQTTPPAAKDFFDIFQKFKFSFILLARMKHEIFDPNASELVHTLFEPLELIVEASRDPTANGKPLLATQVVSPLLTAEVQDMFENCLSSKQSDLLRSLGPAWTIPRNQWLDAVPAFSPTFSDGYRPPTVWLDEVLTGRNSDSLHRVNETSTFNGTAQPQASRNPTLERVNGHSSDTDFQMSAPARNEEIKQRLARDYTRRQELELRVIQRQSQQSDSADTLDRRQQDYLRELQARAARVVAVTQSRQPNNSQEISLEANEILELLDDSRNWWKVRNCRGETGFAPKTNLRLWL